MTIAEMHTAFRQYAQQMGMQQVRAILPTQIDVLLNTSISDIVNQVIKESVALTNDRVIADDFKIGQINALRTLYRVSEVPFGQYIIDAIGEYKDAGGNIITGNPLIKAKQQPNALEATASIGQFRCNTFIDVPNSAIDALYLVSVAINYKEISNVTHTAYYPVRIIDDVYLAQTLQDFILKPRVRNPICVLYNGILDIYLGEYYKRGNGALPSDSIVPDKLRISYLAKPAKVAYNSDLTGVDVHCDLPETMHVDIVKHAVDLYNIAVQQGLYMANQNAQSVQRGNAGTQPQQ